VRAYVTGGSGFIGSHLVRELRERGAEVRDDFVELSDRPGLECAMAGCDVVFHVAALYSFDAPARELERVNVEGTRNVVEACAAKGVRRLVHTSSSATCGPVRGRPATEEDSPPQWELSVPYKSTKIAAERLVLASGLDAVVVNPTTPVGDGDFRPTPTGRMVRGVASGRYRAFLDIGLNVVDVRDVARGHLLALEHGRRGERYILGGANVTLEELFAAIARLAGRPRPRLRLPQTAVRAAALLGIVNRNEARLSRLPAYFSSAKAERELGYRAGPVEPALARAVADALAVSGGGRGASASAGPERSRRRRSGRRRASPR
jgi:dihydroflavonol-4-reductase